MSNLRNSVQLIGNLGKDAEFKKLDNGRAMARVSIATREVFKNQKGQKVIDVQWHQLVGWGKTAEIMEVLLKKGREVAVQGKLTHRSYQDETGKTYYLSEIVVQDFALLG